MKIDFEFNTQYGKFCDALHFADDQVPDAETIEAIKKQRLDNWIAVITAPSVEEPSVADPSTQEV